MVLAGAGSGKTRVLTYRLAHLVYDYQIPLSSVLAMTFSNKAAREMHERVKALLKDDSPLRFPWISTFHSVAARLLRRYGDRLGYGSDFVIYDDADQTQIMKDVFSQLNLSDKEISHDTALHRIGEWKNQGHLWHEVESFSTTWSDEKIVKAYEVYAASLKRAQAMDFDDLLLNWYRLLKDHDDLKDLWSQQWTHLLVDEFQDTNDLQYKILKCLVNEEKNICVVGDDDQSIYGWRGAKVENILNFDREFSDCTVVKLEENYRSTGNILKAAMSVISKNEMRHSKSLWTKAQAGQKVLLKSLDDDRIEARFIVGEMQKYIRHGVSPSEIAVLYRVNSLSRGFEEECLRARLPYRIVGGFRFYERKEIKDLMAYARFIINPADIISFRRSIGAPSRGIGKSSLEKAEELILQKNISMGEWLMNEEATIGTSRAREAFIQYRDLVRWGRNQLNTETSLADLFVEILRQTNYSESLEDDGDADRIENIRELLSAVQEFEEEFTETEWARDNQNKVPTLQDRLRAFLEHASLMSERDGDSEDLEKVTFMSLHAAKGLEFKICFMAGMEDGLFPSARSFDSYDKSEEERRLCYVGMTRAREKLILTRAERRRVFGNINFAVPSRFLKDLPKDILEPTSDTAEESPEPPQRKSWASYSGGSKAQARQNTWEDFSFDQRSPEELGQFHKGDRVVHPSFGEGIVQKSEYLGEDECLSVAFQKRGLKKVLAKFMKKAG